MKHRRNRNEEILKREKPEKFLVFKLDKTVAQEGGISNTRIKDLTFGMKTFSIYIDSHFINNMISYLAGV
jgi:hypothetical protein